MKLKLFLIISIFVSNLYANWFTDLFASSNDKLPSYYLKHPIPNKKVIYGVGVGETYLDSKAVALNDIAVQLKSRIKSITTVDKSLDRTNISTNITILTDRKIDNYKIIKEDFVNDKFYLLILFEK